MQDQCTTASFSCLLSKREHSPGLGAPTLPGGASWNLFGGTVRSTMRRSPTPPQPQTRFHSMNHLYYGDNLDPGVYLD